MAYWTLQPPPPRPGRKSAKATELKALLTGAGPGIQKLLSYCAEPKEVAVNGRVVQLRGGGPDRGQGGYLANAAKVWGTGSAKKSGIPFR